ncbi:MAG: GntR family transcriptional regulator [Syntrophomonadaceae bacterium]|nr:GntR family transcriptional regulator [Syntrophomonadaceae bacterium]
MFELDLRSRAPIYEQLVDKIKELIINNVLKPDEQLPTVRVLASELTINPNTIQKAYRELENRGYIYSVPGKGNFVRAAVPDNNTARLQLLQREVLKNIAEMRYLGMNSQEIIALMQRSLSPDEGGKAHD